MTEFKKRLKEFGSNLLFWLIAIVIAVLISVGLYALPTIVTQVIAAILGGLVLLGVVVSVLYSIGKGVYWLFIEPFRKK